MDPTLQTPVLADLLDTDSRKRRLLVAWLYAGQHMPRALWNELPQMHQELARIELCSLGLHAVMVDQQVRAVPDPRD